MIRENYFHPIIEKPVEKKLKSWYEASSNIEINYPVLTGTKKTDVFILGAGSTGLSSALFLAKSGIKTIVADKNKVGWGASGRNGGQFIVGLSCSHSKAINLVGKERAKILFDESVRSVQLVLDLVKEHNIDCDLRQGHITVGYKKSRHDRDIEESVQLFEKLGFSSNIEFINHASMKDYIGSEVYGTGYKDRYSGHLHPLNFTLGLAKAADENGVEIFENTEVLSVKKNSNGYLIKTSNGEVQAKDVILAGNAYLEGVSSIRSKIMPVGTYIAATEPLSETETEEILPGAPAVADINFILDYYRLAPNRRLLFGGRVSYSKVPPLDIGKSLNQRIAKVFPKLAQKRIDYAWGGFVAITMNRAPHFGRTKEGIYFAQGYSGHGVALSVLAGKLLSEVLQSKPSRFSDFEKIQHHSFPGGKYLRTPSLVLASTYFKIRDLF